MEIRPFARPDEEAVIDLWRRCGLLRPWNDPQRDIARKQGFQPEWFLVGVSDGAIVATVMAGYDGHRGWLNYLAVDPQKRRKGYGRAIMAEAERLLRAVGCPKINLQIRRDNLNAIRFYERIGFAEDAVVSYGKRLIRDD
ncbi:MAG: GNAT family acetyltransferase [Desulfobacterales bacterium]|jgi:ribosomal protein S18 acetylase RimI-like enzyme|nr:GNAT family acetyltransferase [Desulfobacterales bacterium]